MLRPLLLAAAAALFAGSAAAASLLDRLDLAPGERAALERHCGGDPVCAARRLAATRPDRFRLLPVRHPTTDRIRWVETTPSIGTVEPMADGRLRVELLGFGRELLREWRARVPEGRPLVLDLRRHPGGDLARMLALAAMVAGEGVARVAVLGADGVGRRAGRSGMAGNWDVVAVLVGPGTASSAEVLAALLARAGARLCGTRSRGKDWLEAVVPVSHDLRLGARIGTLRVEGVPLAGGLVPALPAEACLDGAGAAG